MKTFGIVSYNKYANYTNYGSALQSWALNTVVNRIGKGIGCRAMFIDYCPDCLADMDPLNPFKKSWDQDEHMKRMIEMTMPAIHENYKKFMEFYDKRFFHTSMKYTPENFNDIVKNEGVDGFICGSDTIFCHHEFGFDDGYFANYECMKGRSVAYAPSFGDTDLSKLNISKLKAKLRNFKYIALRENEFLPFVSESVDVPVRKVVDPTLLLEAEDYAEISAPSVHRKKYLLLYSRRYNPVMEAYAEEKAKENGWDIIEISLRAMNAERHEIRYDAGVEEFLSLVKGAEYVITNSFHGMIMAVHYRRDFEIFSREQCDNKITEILQLFELPERMVAKGNNLLPRINYDKVHLNISRARKESLITLKEELTTLVNL